jgi:amidase
MAELHELTALEQAAAVRGREVSPVELVEHYLGRIGAHNDDLGAFVTVTGDLALEQAREAEAMARTASTGDGVPDHDLPVLHGVPVAIKDLTMVSGVRCMLGSAAYRDFVAPHDDHVVTLLVRRGGMPVLGKTNAPEFGLPCYTESAVASPARTPWDLTRNAGGSSGGAAAAVSAGLAPVAQGNDGGGSVRIPASCCGLVGLKVSRGRVSNGPISGDVSGLAWHGPIARTVGDAAAMLDLMAVPMPGDPHWAPPLAPGETFLQYAKREPGRLRIGRFATPVIAETTVHPASLAAYEQASELLDSLGHQIVDISPPFGPDAVPAFERVWSVLACLAPVGPEAEARLMPLTRWLRERGRGVSGIEYASAVAAMQETTRRVITAWHGYDAVLTPTLAELPAPVGALRNDADPAADFEAQKEFTPFTSVYNVTGQPAITLPLHWAVPAPGAPELPVGIMLAGRPAGEAQLLSVAAQLEAAVPTWHRHPPGW